MGWIGRILLSGVCALCDAPVPADAQSAPAASANPTAKTPPAQTQHFFGPLRVRDLTPFGYLRLDMRPTYGEELALGVWALETELA